MADETKKYISDHGRRKEASASVRIYKGQGATTVNGVPFSEYFSGDVAQARLSAFLNLVKEAGDYYATIRVAGSGKESQTDAAFHGLARTYATISASVRTSLKKAGFLTRDPRVRERRKFGMAQKARKGKQSPKR